jgi:multidrug efflux pump subunit AcrA (membrane-fusion protein)
MNMIHSKPLKLTIIGLIILVGGVMFSACGAIPTPGTEAAEPTDIPVVIADSSVVVEGRLVPNETVNLAFSSAGEVAEVLIEEGDLVSAGDVLARLGNREPLEANIANAELELLNAQQALDKLEEQAEIASDEALRRIAQATRALRDAQYQRDNYTVPIDQADLEAIEGARIMKEILDAAQADFDLVKNRSSTDSTRRDYKEALDNAQSDYNAAVKRLEYEIAVEAAESDLEKALSDYATFQEGPKAEDIEAAQARINAAEANLVSAQAALDSLDLVATIDGTVVDLNIIEGEQVSPGAPVVQITDFSTWFVETDNLTEIEVVEISDGQSVEIVPDALPDETLEGVVDEISDQFVEKRGDVTYTVRILVDEIDPRLRWGMTVIVTFDVSE